MTRCVYIILIVLVGSLVGCARKDDQVLFNREYENYCAFFHDFARFTLNHHVFWGPEDYDHVTQAALKKFQFATGLDPVDGEFCDDLRQGYTNQDSTFDSEEAYFREFIQTYLHTLDPHSRYISPDQVQANKDQIENKKKRSGVEFYYRNYDIGSQSKNNPVWVDYVHDHSYPGLPVGAQLEKVENQPVGKFSFKDFFQLLRGKSSFSIQSNEQEFTIEREKDIFPSFYIKDLDIGGAHVAWVRLLAFTQGSSKGIIKDLELRDDVDAIVMDLRGNGGGLLRETQFLLEYFLPKGHVYSEVNYNRGTKQKFSTSTVAKNDKPMTVLIDSGSASASEIFAGAMGIQGRAKVIGNYSYGKMSAQKTYPISEKNGIGGAFSLTRYFLVFSNETTAQYHRIAPHVWYRDPEATLISEEGKGYYEHQSDSALKPSQNPTAFGTKDSFEIQPCPIDNLRQCTHHRISSYTLE